ncbi:MAG: extracellular solute-binding protein [Oscillospiraceae bacterium]|nr:extracellular solute-binding protein [Oscillospiraceae bacterium]
MKKTLTAIIALLLSVLMLASCGAASGNTSSESQPSEPEQSTELGSADVTITFWHSASDQAGVIMDEIVKSFNETNGKNITVNAVYQGQYSDATSLLQTMLSAKNYSDLPDIMQTDATGKVPYYNSGRALTIDDALSRDLIDSTYVGNFIPAALSNWKFSNVQLGVPFATSTTVTFYNKTLIDSMGWDHIPESLTDLTAIYNADPSIEKAALQAIPNTPSLANWLGQDGSYLVDQNNGTEGNATKLECIDNGALKKFLTVWKELYESGALLNEDTSKDAFIAGNIPFLITSSSNTAAIVSATEESFETGAMGMLKVDDSSAAGATVSGSCIVLFDSEDDLKIKASAEFLKYLTSDDVQAKFASGTGYIPGTYSSVDSAEYQKVIEEHPQYKAAYEQLMSTPENMKSVTVGPSADFYYAIIDSVSGMLSNNASVEDTVAGMNDQLTLLLEEYAGNNS